MKAAIFALLVSVGVPQLPKSQMPDLGRPTRPNDEQPLFNFDEYFSGKWTFEWDVPEGILGPSGTIKGTIVYKKIDGAFFQADTTATLPQTDLPRTLADRGHAAYLSIS